MIGKKNARANIDQEMESRRRGEQRKIKRFTSAI
jgi:hypothetical protein